MTITHFENNSARRVFRAMWLAAFVFAAFGWQNLPAQPLSAAQPAPALRPANRWLFIVETSRATQPRSEAFAQMAANLLLSGMNGQMRERDTVGLWTFNDELHAGEFSLQVWSPDEVKSVAARTATFLATRKFENRPRLDKVLPAMNGVISNSAFITVILITSGAEPMRGTRFDSEINPLYRKWQSQQEKAKLPIVTVLRGHKGRATDFAVNIPPAMLDLPPLPPELLIENPVVKIAAAPVEPKPVAVVPSLIVRGKRPESEPEPAVTNSLPLIFPATNQPAAAAAVPPTLTPTNVTVATNNTTIAASSTNQTAGAAATESSSGTKKYWVISGVIGFASIVLIALLVRRPRPQHASLITRSLDRDQK